jgi:hypothetical protein
MTELYKPSVPQPSGLSQIQLLEVGNQSAVPLQEVDDANESASHTTSSDIADHALEPLGQEPLVESGQGGTDAQETQAGGDSQSPAPSAATGNDEGNPMVLARSSRPSLAQIRSFHSQDDAPGMTLRERTTWPRNETGTYLPTSSSPPTSRLR